LIVFNTALVPCIIALIYLFHITVVFGLFIMYANHDHCISSNITILIYILIMSSFYAIV